MYRATERTINHNVVVKGDVHFKRDGQILPLAECRDAWEGGRCDRKRCVRHWKWWKISQVNHKSFSAFPDYVLSLGFNISHIPDQNVFDLFGTRAGFILIMACHSRKQLMSLIDRQSVILDLQTFVGWWEKHRELISMEAWRLT